MRRPQRFAGRIQWGDVWGSLLESAIQMWSVIITGEKGRHEMWGENRAFNSCWACRLGLCKQMMTIRPWERHRALFMSGSRDRENPEGRGCSQQDSGKTRRDSFHTSFRCHCFPQGLVRPHQKWTCWKRRNVRLQGPPAVRDINSFLTERVGFTLQSRRKDRSLVQEPTTLSIPLHYLPVPIKNKVFCYTILDR